MTDLLTLDDLAIKHDTDKSSIYHNYSPVYQGMFEPLRHQPMNLLELGVYRGASLKMWADYFTHPETIIAGIDINLGTQPPKNSSIEGSYLPFRQRYGKPASGEISCYLGDQTKVPTGLKEWCPDIIIDDASHRSSLTIGSFKTWFPILKHGGLYVIEDLTTSYDTHHCGEEEASPDPDLAPRQAPQSQTTMQYLRRLADEVQAYAYMRTMRDEYVLGYEIASLHFYPNMAVLHKMAARPCHSFAKTYPGHLNDIKT